MSWLAVLAVAAGVAMAVYAYWPAPDRDRHSVSRFADVRRALDNARQEHTR